MVRHEARHARDLILSAIANSPNGLIRTTELEKVSGLASPSFYRLRNDLLSNGDILHYNFEGNPYYYLRGDVPPVETPQLTQTELAALHSAAKLGVHLYYFAQHRYDGHKRLALSLGQALRIGVIKEILDDLEKGDISPQQSMNEIHFQVESRYEKIISSAYDLTRFSSLGFEMTRSNPPEFARNFSRLNIQKRIVAELSGMGADLTVREYARRRLPDWVTLERETGTKAQTLTENFHLLFALLNKYAVDFLYETVDDPVVKLLGQAPSITTKDFAKDAHSVIAADIGTIRILRAGPATSSNHSYVDRRLRVQKNSVIRLWVDLEVINLLPHARARMIYVGTWLPARTSWRPVGVFAKGANRRRVTVELMSPESGEWYVLFAFRAEVGPEFVASSTDSPTFSQPIWNDGNDLALIGDPGIKEGQANGHTYANEELLSYGYAPFDLPLDAIEVKVQ